MDSAEQRGRTAQGLVVALAVASLFATLVQTAIAIRAEWRASAGVQGLAAVRGK